MPIAEVRRQWRRARPFFVFGGWVALDSAIVVFLAWLPCLFFWRILTGNTADVATFPLGDFTELHFPYRHWAAEELIHGRLPTWNPFLSSGHPSLGDIQFGLLYPINTLFARMFAGDLTVLGLEQQVILHFSIATVGLYLFARATGAGRPGSMVAAIGFAFSGHLTSFPVQQIIILQTSVWLPWILLGLELGIGRRQLIGGVLVAASTMMAALVGHPQTLGYVLGLATAYGLIRLYRVPSLRGLIAAAVGGPIGLALAAPALLPALEHLRLTARTDVGYSFTSGGFPAHELLGFIYPTDLGGRGLYVGVPIICLVLVVIAARRPGSYFRLGVVIVAGLLSLGGNTFLYPALYAVIPGFQFFRNHERSAVLVTFALSMLAAHGLTALLAANRDMNAVLVRRIAIGAAAVAGIFMIVTLLGMPGLMVAQGDQRNQLGALGDRAVLTALFAILTAALLFAARYRAASTPMLGVFAVLLVTIDLFSTSWTASVAPGSPEKLLRSTPTTQFLMRSAGPLERVATEGVLPADGNAGALFRFSDIVGNSPLDLQAYRTFGDKVDEFQRWRMLGVRYLVTKRKIEDPRILRVFVENDLNTHEIRRDLRLPRAWLVHRVLVASDADQELELTRRIKPEEEVVLPAEVGRLDGRAPERPVAEGTDVLITSDLGDAIELRSWSRRDALLVMSERDYPGWTARIDGQPVPVLRANSILRGIYLPSGEHTIAMRFDPPGFAEGLRWAERAYNGMIVLAVFGVLVPLAVWSRPIWAGILSSGRLRYARRGRVRRKPVEQAPTIDRLDSERPPE